MISYLQAVNVIKTFADDHLQINRFDFEFKEQMQNLATLNEAYPFLYVVPLASDTITNVNEFEVEIYCVDRLQKDRTNVNYVVSDTNQILNDLVLWLEEGQDDIEIVGTATQTPINNDLLDYVGGWVLRVRLQVEKIGLCEIPLGGEMPPPPTCEDATFQNSDESFVTTIASGDTYTSDDVTVNVYDQNETFLGTATNPSNVDFNVVVELDPCPPSEVNAEAINSLNEIVTTAVLTPTNNQILAPDATIHNSDYSFQQSLPSGSDTQLGDVRVVISNSSDTKLIDVFLPSNQSIIQNFPDTEIVLKNSLDEVIDIIQEPSGVSNDLTAPDAHLRIKKSGGTDIVEIDLPSGSDEVQTISDSVITLKDSANTTISTTNVQATETANITAPDGLININGSSVGNVKSNGTRNLFVKLNGTNSGTFDGTDTINVTSSDAWVRPTGWLPLDTVGTGTQNFSGLFAVYETQKNVCTIQLVFPSGTRTINWGDGTTQSALSNTLYTKVYDYATISSPILTDDFGYNYKMVVVNIPMTSATQLYIDRNTTATLINNGRSLNWLDVALDCSTLTLFVPSQQGIANKLQRLLIYNVGAIIDGNTYYTNLTRLRVLKFPFAKLQNSVATFINYFGDVRDESNNPIDMTLSINTGGLNSMFANALVTKLGNISAPTSISGQSMFENNLLLRSIGTINLPLATNIVTMFSACVNLESVVNITISSSCTSIFGLGQNIRKCRGFIISNCSGITNTSSAFTGMASMETLILTGITRGFTIDDCNMSATAINALFTSLGNAVGSQTINVRRNPGSATCTTSIATSKGYTVVIA
jgi:hypothetical protein